VAKVGSGSRLGNMAIAIYNQGQRALPHGTCPGVGIGGHATHGGYGYDSRIWGLALDRIVALDVVLANGTEVHATNVTFPEVFYAMRGAADSFGIVTNFYMLTEPAPAYVLNFEASLASSLQGANVDYLTTGFEKLQNFALTSPLLTPNLTFGMYTDYAGSLRISGWCMECDPVLFNNTVSPHNFPSHHNQTAFSYH
jgi:FAD/FMN-containing dehydrogenase